MSPGRQRFHVCPAAQQKVSQRALRGWDRERTGTAVGSRTQTFGKPPPHRGRTAASVPLKQKTVPRYKAGPPPGAPSVRAPHAVPTPGSDMGLLRHRSRVLEPRKQKTDTGSKSLGLQGWPHFHRRRHGDQESKQQMRAGGELHRRVGAEG